MPTRELPASRGRGSERKVLGAEPRLLGKVRGNGRSTVALQVGLGLQARPPRSPVPRWEPRLRFVQTLSEGTGNPPLGERVAFEEDRSAWKRH